jgi:receptor expression-enhancing protein 1/2/3/4|tara:strand:- start:3033 stop:3437 length:405 start_codon:yes stop_codon:yes gene_type:complete
MYWTVMGVYTVGVQIADRFIFFLPMYSEAKVAFVVCLWHPRTTWALYVYSSWLAPFLSKHEPEIDRRIDETRTGFGDVVVRHSNDVTAWAREKFAAALAALPQATPTGGGGGGGFAARNATEAAAMAYTRPKKQ